MGQKILAIDDSPTLRKFIVKSLSGHSANLDIATAANGEEGIHLAKQQLPALILLDFLLPDMDGEEVCRQLSQDESTRNIPIILMSSSAAEIRDVEQRFDSVVRSVAKPFTPEVLSSSVSFVLRSNSGEDSSQGSPALSGNEGLLFSGSSAYFSMINAIRGIEETGVTGVLRIKILSKPIEAYFRKGKLVVITTRDVGTYLQNSNFNIPAEYEQTFEEAKQAQINSAAPLFLMLNDKQLLSLEEASTLVYQYGCALFSRIWTSTQPHFEFEVLSQLPEYCNNLQAPNKAVDEWAIESLRLVGDESLSAQAWGEPTGVPAYTRFGFDRIQQIGLNEDELKFAEQVNKGGVSLEIIAKEMDKSVEEAQQVLFRFMCLEIFDYWPTYTRKHQGI